jgi:GTP-binding protein
VELLTVNVPESFSGKVIELVTVRKGELLNIETKSDRINLEFHIPARGLIGLRNKVLTATEGEAIMAHRFKSYMPWKGELPVRKNGSLVAMESGMAVAYAIDKLQDRGRFFVAPGEDIYSGMVVGENNKEEDLIIKVTKTKKLTNMRAAGADDKVKIAPPVKFSLEEALEYIKEDEYLEVTPKRYRMRKILLDENDRKKAGKVV